MSKPFAIVTGASSGIGLELATICAREGFDLLVAADRSDIQSAADRFRDLGAAVTVVEADLAATETSIGCGQPLRADPSMCSWRMRGMASAVPSSIRTLQTCGM